jgi:hypothetical protein
LDPRLTALLCRKSIVAKSKEVETGCHMTEFSEEGCGSKNAILPMMMMMMIMTTKY